MLAPPNSPPPPRRSHSRFFFSPVLAHSLLNLLHHSNFHGSPPSYTSHQDFVAPFSFGPYGPTSISEEYSFLRQRFLSIPPPHSLALLRLTFDDAAITVILPSFSSVISPSIYNPQSFFPPVSTGFPPP